MRIFRRPLAIALSDLGRRAMPAGGAPWRRGARGFTLLELLVVITLVAILTGTVVLSITGADSDQRLRGSAEQLAYRLELGRQYALQRNREWGVYLDAEQIRFAEFDPVQSAWIEQTQRPFNATAMLPNVRLDAFVEDYAGLSERDRERLPRILLFSSGEVTPFRLTLEPAWRGRAWVVSSDGLARVSAAPVDA
jgi:type II secretion system protein H